jgi:hypothetical protein
MLALGVLLPYVTSHAFGLQGTTFLPMHFPVLLAGLTCGALYGGVCGVLAPLLSCLITGMPPVYPMLPIMLCELAVYGVLSGLLRSKTKLNIYLVLLIAMLGGRFAYAAAFDVLFYLSGSALKALTAAGAVVAGLPGIVLQILVVPALAVAIGRIVPRKGAAA